MDKDWRLKIYWTECLPVYDDRYIKTKIRAYGNKVYTNFRTNTNTQMVDYLGDNLSEFH